MSPWTKRLPTLSTTKLKRLRKDFQTDFWYRHNREEYADSVAAEITAELERRYKSSRRHGEPFAKRAAGKLRRAAKLFNRNMKGCLA